MGECRYWGCRTPELYDQRVKLEKELERHHQGLDKGELDTLVNRETNYRDASLPVIVGLMVILEILHLLSWR